MQKIHAQNPALARQSAIFVLVITVLVALPIWSFAWSSAKAEPHNVPLGVAGAPAAVAPLKEALGQKQDAFSIHVYDDAAEAKAGIENREVYGAVVVTPSNIELMTASAASPAVTQLLSGFANKIAADQQVKVTDVVSSGDGPRGATLGIAILPLVIVAAVAGVIVLVLASTGWEQTLGVFTTAILAGLITVAIVQSWLGALGGNWWANVGTIALMTASITACVVGFTAIFGRPGLGLTMALMLFIANPWSGVMSAPELLPQPAGLLGQLMPPGAGGNLLRSTAFFDGAGSGSFVLVLVIWLTLGLIGIALGARRTGGMIFGSKNSQRLETAPAHP